MRGKVDHLLESDGNRVGGTMRLYGRRSLRSLSAIALLAVGASLGCGGEGGGSTRFMSLGTAGTGGIYYPLGGAIASRLSLRDSLRQYTAEVTGGSVENINRLRGGEMDLAFALAITMWEAQRGSADYPEPVSDLRVLAPLYPNLTHVLVTPGSGIGSVGDFAGKRVAVGPPGSGTEQLSRQILSAHGLSYDDIDEQFLSFAESAAALKDRAIDAALISVGFPASSVLDATTTGGIELLPIAPEVIQQMARDFPYFLPGEMPSGAYPGVEEPITTLAVMNWVVALEGLDADVVKHLLTVLVEERDALIQVHPQAAQIDLAALASPPIPLHPAVEAWRSAGGG